MTELLVIIVTHNTCDLVCAAVRSVLESADTLRKEIVVVDNGSTDSTPSVLPHQFPGVRYIRSEKNLGFACANNLGAKGSDAEFILLLNSDARLQPDSIASAVGWMREHSNCGIVGAQLLNTDGSLQNSIANFPSLATELLNKSLLRRLFPKQFPGKEHRFIKPVIVDSVIGAFMLVRGFVWRAIDGFDERYFFFFEETDFCFQARRRRWHVVHVPQVRVCHEQGKSVQQMPVAARIEYWRSRYIYFHKNRKWLACGLLRTGLLGRLLVDWLFSGLLCLVTWGHSPHWRNKFNVHTALWRWHLRGCPASQGLPR